MRELMALPVEAITYEDVVNFCSHQTPENMRLEYKQKFSVKNAGKQIAKEVAAFANTQGGTLIFGVEEDSNRRPVQSPTGEDLGSNPRQTVITACVHEIFPPVIPGISDYLPNPNDASRGFLVVRVGPSEDVHTIDAGRGVYLRANDQSEPVQATIDQIEWLLERRRKAISLQEQRREDGTRQLRDAIQRHEKIPTVEVAIGPKLLVEPLIDLRELRTVAQAHSVPSHCFSGRRQPIPSQHEARSVADGVYWLDGYVDRPSQSGGKLDVFGNVILVTNLMRDHTIDHFGSSDDELHHLEVKEGKVQGINVACVLERLLCCVRVADNIQGAIGYVGTFELLLRVPNVGGCPLVFPSHPFAHLLGRCPLDTEICVRRTYFASDLSTEPLTLLADFVYELLWAWGRVVEAGDTAHVIDMGEQYHYGQPRCQCGRSRPANREACLTCRTGIG